MLGGVAAGTADYFDVDVTLARVLWVVAGVMGWGILVYLVMWILVPPAPTPASSASSPERIAEERYARGEISAQELDEIRRNLARG
jgi:phage shock protein PspC (stress-responsive transcriptional regulator)